MNLKQSDKHQFVVDKLLRFKSLKILSEKFENIHTQGKDKPKKKKKKPIHIDANDKSIQQTLKLSFMLGALHHGPSHTLS